ncbi:MAG: type II secretion system F family protein [Lachnospiraceae bacterium]|nr:type II secretion system F family protein [Lachnospiraceae bacterium]
MILKIRQSFAQAVLRYRLHEVKPSPADWTIFAKGVGVVILFGYFFYRSVIACVILSPILLPYYVMEKRKKNRRNAAILGQQFKDAVMAVATAMRAGYAVENAFLAAEEDMRLLYGKGSLIVTELHRISAGLGNNVVLETLLNDFANRSHNEDIREFAEVFQVAKRSGGNMTQILMRTAIVIGARLDVEKEIDVLLSAKKMEAKIMEVVPFFIVFYVGITSRGFFDPLYHNPFGILMMSGCLILYLIAYLMLEKIIDIRI